MTLKACSGDVPGNSVARGAVINFSPSTACGAQSLRCSIGKPSLCIFHTNELSSNSVASKSESASLSRRCLSSWLRLAGSSASPSIWRSNAAINAGFPEERIDLRAMGLVKKPVRQFVPFDARFVEAFAIAGTAQDALAQARRYREAGTSELVLTFVGNQPEADMAELAEAVARA